MIVWSVLFLLAAWALPHRWQQAGMLAVALTYVGMTDPDSLGVLLALAVASHWVMRLAPRLAFPLIVAAVVVVLAKVRLQFNPLDPTNVAAFLGLSYYALRILHVASEHARGQLPTMSFADYLHYLAFLPALVAGPIHDAAPFRRDGQRRRWSWDNVSVALERILYGAFKVYFLGNWFCGIYFAGWLDRHEFWPLWTRSYLECLQYGANLYFQFAGYSDLAIGCALLAGYRLPENFDRPFLARNINEFWQRWHMSLTHWCREYVFMPVMARSRSPYLASVASMMVLGFWHELSPRYVVWGLYQGAGIVVWHAFRALAPRLPAWPGSESTRVLVSRVITMNFIVLSFAVTKENELSRSWDVLSSILTFRSS